MNETYYLKFGGKVNVPSKVEIGHNYKLTADCSVVSEQRSDNEDGTFSFTSKVMPITVEITKDNGEVIKAGDPRSVSQKIRKLLWKLHDQEGYVEHFDDVYEQVGFLIMRDLPSYLQEAVKRLEK